jgi:hypothetical protein
MKFKKRPVVIEAFKWMVDEVPQWWADQRGNKQIEVSTGSLFIETLEGTHKANPGDWIIQGVKGEVYPCKPDIFEMTYEKVEE